MCTEKMERAESTKLPHEIQRILLIFPQYSFFSPSPKIQESNSHFNLGIQPLITQLMGSSGELSSHQVQGVPDWWKGDSIPTVIVMDSGIVMCHNNRPGPGILGRVFSLVLRVGHQALGYLLFLWTHVQLHLKLLQPT